MCQQCEALDIPYEILCFDDCSTPDFQDANTNGLTPLKVKYHILPSNIGRSRIRNKLIEASIFNNILFIDSDHRIESENYLKNYIDCLEDNSWSIIYGGTQYATKPLNADNCLHWHYGSTREAIGSTFRNQKSWQHTHTNNLLIRKKDLGGLRFDTTIYGYGYEDIVFAKSAADSGLSIIHIDNPLTHLGLKQNLSFFEDLKTASENLATLYTQSKLSDLKVIRYYEFMREWKLDKLYFWMLKLSDPILKRMLQNFPNQLYLVDGLRLFYFAQGVQSQRKS